jgi:hypothetical protein
MPQGAAGVLRCTAFVRGRAGCGHGTHTLGKFPVRVAATHAGAPYCILSLRFRYLSRPRARGSTVFRVNPKNGWPVSASAGAMTRLFLRSAALISPRARGEWPKTNTRVTSRKLNRRGCDQHQCQRGFPILCGRKRHKINIRRIYNAVSKRRSLSDTKKTFTSPKKITTSQPVV